MSKNALEFGLRRNMVPAEDRSIRPNGDPFARISMFESFQELSLRLVRPNERSIRSNGGPFAQTVSHSPIPAALVNFL